MRKKNVLLSISLVLFLSVMFLYGDDTEIERLRREVQANGCTFTVGETSVSQLSLEKLWNLQVPANWSEDERLVIEPSPAETELELPSHFDWREYGKVPPVKNVGFCGAHWAFPTIDCYECAILVNGGPTENLSEQFLIDCNTQGYGCTNGWWDFDDMYDGVPLESCYPYTGVQGECNTSCPLYYPLESWAYVEGAAGVPRTKSIKKAIYNHGPVVAAVYVNSAFQNYTSGIFDYCQPGSVNHGIILVGWDDSGGYWILRNFWGTGWGESGYMRIKYGCNQVGFGAAYAIPGGIPYYIFLNRFSGNAMDVNSGSNYVYHYPYNGNIDKHWKIVNVGGGYVRIVNRYNGQAIAAGDFNFVVLPTSIYNGDSSILWQIIDLGNGYYKVNNRYSGNCLDVNSGSNYVYHFLWNGNIDKQWQIVPVE